MLSSRMLHTILREAAEAGAAEILRFFQGSFEVSNKEGVNNLVTEADHASEKAILSVIKKAFPDHQILAEESGALEQSSDYKWIIDPIDGTVNFAHGVPLCCISIAVKKDAAIVLGAIYNPMMDLLDYEYTSDNLNIMIYNYAVFNILLMWGLVYYKAEAISM